MPSGHHRRRSPSPYSTSSSSVGGHRSDGHRPSRKHKPSATAAPPPPYHHNSRPKLDHRRPELHRSMSEDTYRNTARHGHRHDKYDRGREHSRDRDRGGRYHSDDNDDDYYRYDRHGRPYRSRSDSYSRSRSRSRNRGGGHHDDRDRDRDHGESHHRGLGSLKPIVEDVLAAFGLVTAKHEKDKHRGRDRGGHDDRHRSRSRSHNRYRGDHHHDHVNAMMDPNANPSTKSAALRAAVTAAALEAFRSRKEFPGMTPERLLRIAGAAVAAGGLDAIVQRDGQPEGSTRKMIESVIGGMKSSSAFGHRIRRRHGLSASDQMKYRLMHAATAKILDRPFGHRDTGLRPKNKRSRSSTGLSSLMRSMTVK